MDKQALAYEIICRQLKGAGDADPSRVDDPMPDTLRTGIRLFAESVAILLPTWLASWSCLSWARTWLAGEDAEAVTVLYFWPDHLLFLGALPPLVQATICARRGRDRTLRSRLLLNTSPFVRLLVSFALAVAISFLFIDADLRDLGGGYFATHGIAFAVATPLVLASYYAQFVDAVEEDVSLYSGYRSLSASRIDEISFAECEAHVQACLSRGELS